MTLYADDLAPGQQFPFGHYTVSEADILDYARQWDPIYIHTDPDAARDAGLGGVIASGLHTLAIYQRLAAAALWSRVAGGAGRTFDVRFRRPVPPGTTLTGHIRVDSVTPRPERGNAAVVTTSQLTCDDGEVALQISVESILPLRQGAAAATPRSGSLPA